MRRRASSIFVAGLLLAAVLAPGPLLRSASAQPACPAAATGEAFRTMVRDSSLIVLGALVRSESVPNVTDLGHLVVKPEAFLKGPTRGGEIAYSSGMPGPCQSPSGVKAGDRLLVISTGDASKPAWPEPGSIYRITSGQAQTLLRGDTTTQPEADLVAQIRSQTNQFSVPASSNDDGAGIDWKTTIIPVGIAIVLLLGAGLFLMRIWHRIDPS